MLLGDMDSIERRNEIEKRYRYISEDSVACPYCGKINDVLPEEKEAGIKECAECGRKFSVAEEHVVNMAATPIVEESCICHANVSMTLQTGGNRSGDFHMNFNPSTESIDLVKFDEEGDFAGTSRFYIQFCPVCGREF